MTKEELIVKLNGMTADDADDYLDELDIQKGGRVIAMDDYLPLAKEADGEAADLESDFNYWLNPNDSLVWADDEAGSEDFHHLFSGNDLAKLVDEAIGLDEVLKAINDKD